MSRQFWAEGIAWATADGTAYHTSTTETALVADVTLPGNYLADGRWIRVTGRGRYSTTSAPTLAIALRLGGVGGTVIWQTGAITMGSGQTALPWEVVVDIQVRSNGATGTVFAMGRFSFNLTSTTATTLVMGSAGTATPAAVTVDLTVDQALCITGDWGTNSASNTTTLHQAFVEALN